VDRAQTGNRAGGRLSPGVASVIRLLDGVNGGEAVMTELERLIAMEAIRDTHAKKLRTMDLKDWDGYAALHTEDAWSETWKHSLPPERQPVSPDGIVGRAVGPAAITEQLRRYFTLPTPMISVHHNHASEISFHSDTEATGIWSMEDSLWWQNGAVEEHLHGYGHYHENFRKVGDRWLITTRDLIRIRVDKTPGFDDRNAFL
jgi:hypothetical protein